MTTDLYKTEASQFGATLGTRYVLMPSLLSALQLTEGLSILDLGCGQGFLFEKIKERNKVIYVGVDSSREQINIARQKYYSNNTTFLIRDIHDLNESDLVEKSFDRVVLSMVLQTAKSIEEIRSLIQQAHMCLKPEGVLVIGATNPYYDYYMRYGLFKQTGVETEFMGYFEEGAPFSIDNYPTENGDFTFHDYHWTLQQYLSAIRGAGLYVRGISDCYPTPSLKEVNEVEYQKRLLFPTYMVISCSK